MQERLGNSVLDKGGEAGVHREPPTTAVQMDPVRERKEGGVLATVRAQRS